MSAGDEPEPIILFGGDQIEWTPIGQSPLDAAYLELRAQMGFELWRRLFEANFVPPESPWRERTQWPHERMQPKPRLDANARVSEYPFVPVDYIITKSRDERRRS